MPLFPLFFMIVLVAIKESLWLVGLICVVFAIKSWMFTPVRLFLTFLLVGTFLIFGRQTTDMTPIESVDLLDAKQNGDRIRYLAAVGERQLIVAATLDEREDLDYERIGWSCQVELTEATILPRVNRGGFDEARWMRTERLAGKFEVKKWGTCHETPGFEARGRRMRQAWMDRMERLPIKQALYIEALVLGEDRLMDQVTLDRFKKFGLLHAIVISGSHIAFLIFTTLWMLKKCRLTRERRAEFVLILLPIYGWLTEWSAPVTRAVCVAFILLLYQRLGRRTDPLLVVAYVAAAQLAYSYTSLYDVGFQLTVGLTIFLLLSRQIWQKMKRPWNWLLISIWAQVMTSLVLQLAEQTEVSPWSPFLNLLIGAWIEWIILPLSFLVGVLLFFPVTGTLMTLHHQSIDLLDDALAAAEQLPVPTVAVHLLSLPLFLVVLAVVVAGWSVAERKWWGHILPVCALLIGSLCMDLRTEERITFLDVGQGDSTVIEKAGETFVIDTGGAFTLSKRTPLRPFDPGSQIVAPFLHTRAETVIDGLILTHADNDHIGGVLGLLKKVRVDTIYFGRYDNQDEKRNAVLEQIKATGTKVEFVKAGQAIRPWLHVIAPAESEAEENDRSIVLLADVAGKSVLLTGDAGVEQEEGWRIGKVDILKAGHHGSKTSTGLELLQQVDPDTVIISAGRNNRYGHPHKEVLERIGENRTIWRTDQDGMITCSSAGCEAMIK
ncbi:DNA internalization-related competence protein ComEC/Rec2 [Exiguobacterium sp. s193]|uniref:DNA internalization-related competence protein ComEC/Rec2 n=1 Tax=Exiguobacterium sp. s193 TaxID=2751207 RepID=UPI001BE9E29B|nr:DNA internalization-related competence protein ComEC/Rec2 [Exiguobacterium sp. s193]